MQKFTQIILAVVILLLAIDIKTVSAMTPSPAMLEQFKKLPRAEQERLAQQYGYDLSALSPAGRGAAEPVKPETQRLQPKHSVVIDQNGKIPDQPKRFGLELFDASISTFAPVSNQPVPANYVLGADDELLLQLFGKQSQTYTLVVARDGTVLIPDVGPLNVAGLTFDTASQLISERIRASSIGVNAAVSMGQLRSINIFVAGEAKHPGAYAVSALTTVTQALFVAGGVSDIGSLRQIEVKRAGIAVAQFDLYDLLLRGDSRNDLHLIHGDVVFVAPVSAVAEVRGEVQRPAIYEVKPSDTMADLLVMAGGAKATGYINSAVLERFNANRLRDLKNLDLTTSADKSLFIQNGDVVRIAATSARVQNQLVLAGAVSRPGFYAWRQGYKVTDIIRSLWSDLLLSADLDYALIVREVTPNGDVTVIQFNLANALAEPNGPDNIQLQPRDTLLVFHHANQHFQREKLNSFIREKIIDSLELPIEQRWLLGDLAAVTFERVKLEDNNQIVALNSAEEPLLIPTPLQQQQMLQRVLLSILNNVFTDPEALQLSTHFNRTELLYPVLNKLRQQASSSQYLQIVTVDGDVKVAGQYPLTQKRHLGALLDAAGGLKDSAYTSRAELSRTSGLSENQNSVEVTHQAINLSAILAGQEHLALQSRDRVNIFTTPDWRKEREITLEGEVRFPGIYTVMQGERLSDVIQRAGGLTENAFAFGSIFTRKQIQEKEAIQVAKLIEQLKSDIATRSLSTEGPQSPPQDTMFMLKELEKIKPVGRLVINLEQIAAQNPLYDMVVEDGDRLMIPRQNRAITIVGEVQHAGSHRFDGSLSSQDYLNLAGGMRKRADDKRVYIIRADGSVALSNTNRFSFARNRAALQPGDTIVVPVDTEYKDSLTLWGQVTQIFYQSAIALAALNSF